MTEYINKAELISYLEENMLWTKRGWEDMTSMIDELPTIDIVTCEECKYWQEGNMDLGIDCHTYANHFCAEGERREDD